MVRPSERIKQEMINESIEQGEKILDKFEVGHYENKGGTWIYTETRKVQYRREATADEIRRLKHQRGKDDWNVKMYKVLGNCAKLMKFGDKYTFSASVNGYEFKIRKEGGECLW